MQISKYFAADYAYSTFFLYFCTRQLIFNRQLNMKRTKIKQLFLDQSVKEVLVYAWVRTNRAQAQFGFLNVNDGSCLANLQVVYDSKLANFEEISKYRVGVSVLVKGNVVLTPSAKQPLEIHATEIAMLGDCPENYPIQPKRHTREFLRENAHLRARTNLLLPIKCNRYLRSYKAC